MQQVQPVQQGEPMMNNGGFMMQQQVQQVQQNQVVSDEWIHQEAEKYAQEFAKQMQAQAQPAENQEQHNAQQAHLQQIYQAQYTQKSQQLQQERMQSQKVNELDEQEAYARYLQEQENNEDYQYKLEKEEKESYAKQLLKSSIPKIDFYEYAGTKTLRHCGYCLNEKLIPCGVLSTSNNGLCDKHESYMGINVHMLNLAQEYFTQGLDMHLFKYDAAVKEGRETFYILMAMFEYVAPYKIVMYQKHHQCKLIHEKIYEAEQKIANNHIFRKTKFNMEQFKVSMFPEYFKSEQYVRKAKRGMDDDSEQHNYQDQVENSKRVNMHNIQNSNNNATNPQYSMEQLQEFQLQLCNPQKISQLRPEQIQHMQQAILVFQQQQQQQQQPPIMFQQPQTQQPTTMFQQSQQQPRQSGVPFGDLSQIMNQNNNIRII